MNYFRLKPNQQEGIDRTIETLCENRNGMLIQSSGIHCHATGTGKTIIGLKIIDEVLKANRYNTKMTIMCFTERKHIIRDQFNVENWGWWKNNNILDMKRIKFLEFVDTNDSKWNEKIDRDYGKPKIVIINRVFLTLKERYKKISKYYPDLIIHDECHSAINNSSKEFLYYAKKEWKASIIGFSATPIKLNRQYMVNEDEKDILSNIFGDGKEINIITNYNIIDVINDELIVPPRFNIIKLDSCDLKNDTYMYLDNKQTSIKKKIKY